MTAETRPAPLGSLTADLRVDREVVVLKVVAAAPAERYGSAAAYCQRLANRRQRAADLGARAQRACGQSR
jgi:hypothetical protein